MFYKLEDRLVIGVASSALFDLRESDEVFKREGEEEYRIFQESNRDVPLLKGVAFPFIRRLLSLNDLSSGPSDPLVEVILLSKNDPDTGLRVMKSIEHHGLSMTRALFTQGRSPYEYMPALNMALFLSGDAADVKAAIEAGHPAGQVLGSEFDDDQSDQSLRIAFDFDGVLASDQSERIMQAHGLAEFQAHEVRHVTKPLEPGPLTAFMVRIAKIQSMEEARAKSDSTYQRRIRVSIVTARNAPAHERPINTLKNWDVMVNDAFFLGGIDKGGLLAVLKPHIFFDDQQKNLERSISVAPSVYVPFGIINQVVIEPPLGAEPESP